MNHKLPKEEIINSFSFEGELVQTEPYGSGHINHTFRLTFRLADGSQKRYILQEMNHEIFKDPAGLMENVVNVTTHLRRKIIENGGDPERETVNIIKTKTDENYLISAQGEYWRAYRFIEDAVCYDLVEKAEDFYESALAFGKFQCLLSDFPAKSLHETIPNFHNTPVRFLNFKKAAEQDVCGRAKNVAQEIQFLMDREKECHILCDMLAKGEIPLRVTHNDTKLNNIMIDRKTGKGICVIDLDTVMPGTALNDFGDSIRFGASTALEDEQDLSKVACDMGLFESFTKGFVEGCNGALTKQEIRMFPMGAKLMTLECGMRFLTDYLENDIYFQIHRENQNLDRCRTQLKLVADMEQKWDTMQKIVNKYS